MEGQAVRKLFLTAGFVLSTALCGMAVNAASAAELPIPSQADWAGAKKSVKLANGLSLAYVEMGDPDGKPTLLIHGYTDNSRSWSLMAPYLKGRRLCLRSTCAATASPMRRTAAMPIPTLPTMPCCFSERWASTRPTWSATRWAR